MLKYEAVKDFIDYIDPTSFLDKNENIIPLENRVLLSNAPESAVKAFADFKKMVNEAKEEGIIL